MNKRALITIAILVGIGVIAGPKIKTLVHKVG